MDRSGAYLGRYIAKHLVAAGICKKALVQIAYAIGYADPVSIYVDCYGTSQYTREQLAKIVKDHFRMKPRQIIDDLNLLQPIYRRTAAYGHFGRSEFPWERLDKVEKLKAAL